MVLRAADGGLDTRNMASTVTATVPSAIIFDRTAPPFSCSAIGGALTDEDRLPGIGRLNHARPQDDRAVRVGQAIHMERSTPLPR
jgi:hypothetical protein